MNLLEKICKELGVEVDEHWKGSDGRTYVIDEVGQLHYYNENSKTGGYINANEIIPKLIIGELKPVWKPKMDERYFIPDILNSDLYRYHIWDNGPADKRWQNLSLVFKTKEEAIAAANKMMKALKEDN